MPDKRKKKKEEVTEMAHCVYVEYHCAVWDHQVHSQLNLKLKTSPKKVTDLIFLIAEHLYTKGCITLYDTDKMTSHLYTSI